MVRHADHRQGIERAAHAAPDHSRGIEQPGVLRGARKGEAGDQQQPTRHAKHALRRIAIRSHARRKLKHKAAQTQCAHQAGRLRQTQPQRRAVGRAHAGQARLKHAARKRDQHQRGHEANGLPGTANLLRASFVRMRLLGLRELQAQANA